MSIIIERSNVRNIAIVAHVDHGKTTLVDKLFRIAGTVAVADGDRLMDSNDLERERGITILAKNTGLVYNGYEINIVDTIARAGIGRLLKLDKLLILYPTVSV